MGHIGFLASPIQDYIYSRASQRNNGNPRSERKLCFSCGGMLMFASRLFWFGWSSDPNVPWIVPILGCGWTIIGIYTIYIYHYWNEIDHRLLYVNYLDDSYSIYGTEFC